MAETKHPTPMLDELENGPWPSFVSGIKRLRFHICALKELSSWRQSPSCDPDSQDPPRNRIRSPSKEMRNTGHEPPSASVTASLAIMTTPSRMTHPAPLASWTPSLLVMLTFRPILAFLSTMAFSMALPGPTPTGVTLAGSPGA